MTRKRRKPVPKSGPEVFPEEPNDPRPIVTFRVAGKILKARMSGNKRITILDPDEYAGKRQGDAA